MSAPRLPWRGTAHRAASISPEDEPSSDRGAVSPAGRAGRFWHGPDRNYLVLLLPAMLVLAARPDAIFPPTDGIDPWVYFGFFRNLVDFQRDVFPGTYYGSRLSWIIPGY